MNRKIRQLAVALIACYVALFAALNYWQVNREEQLESQPDNTRQLLRDFDKPRGPIVTADGVIVARSVPAEADSDVKFVRQYPTGDLFANVTGYHTFALGSTQIERTRTEILTGSTAAQQLRAIPSLLGGDAEKSLFTMANMWGGSDEEKDRRAADVGLLMLNPYFLANVIVLLRRARNEIVWMIGQ